jgi:hypothetical protein
LRFVIESWLTVYGALVARPFLAALWLVALYPFVDSLGEVGLWLWTVPTVIGVIGVSIVHGPRAVAPG